MNERNNQPKPTIVLVHGAFAESSSWDGVIQRLQAQGYTASAAANPLRSLSGDAEYIAGVLKSIEGPVVLVGHSYGGAVITQAARGQENVKSLVYAAAFAPEEGENAIKLAGRFPGSTLGESLRPAPLADGSADLYIRSDKFHQQFAADVAADKAVLMAATQRPVRDVALGEDFAGTPAWQSVPSWFVLAELDQNIPVALQHFMAERAQAREITEVKGASHAISVSHPQEVADLILRAAASVENAMHDTAVAVAGPGPADGHG
jgi:pimeloyl-ACP methyl ester carboxylesterase